MSASDTSLASTQDLQDQVAAQTRALATWAAGVAFEDLPIAVRRKAALVLADDLGAIVGSRNEPELAAFHSSFLKSMSSKEATVFRGGRTRTDRISAAVANAVAADWLELDEGYRIIPCHAGLYVVPALLAEAEAENLPASELVRSLAVAYEVVTRVARAFIPGDDGILCHANYATIGACAAVAAARHLDARQYHEALSAAFTMCFAGPRNHVFKGALVRNTWPAVGAWAGMMSVDWARCGITGLPESAYDALCVCLHATPYPERLTEGLGDSWAVLDGYTKIYACCQHSHSAAEAALDLRKRLPPNTTHGDIRDVLVETHPLAMRLKSQTPTTSLASKFSLPHVVSAALTLGDVGARAFFTDKLNNPGIVSLRSLVRMQPYAPVLPPPNDRPTRISVTLATGQTLTAECLSAAGGPDRPFGEEVVMTKFAELTSETYPKLAPMMRKLIELDEQQLQRGWESVVAEFSS